jgi:ketopantoate reductase
VVTSVSNSPSVAKMSSSSRAASTSKPYSAIGLRIVSDHALAVIHPVNVADAIEEIGPVDLALIGVKLWHTDEVGRRLAPHLSQDSTVLSLQTV